MTNRHGALEKGSRLRAVAEIIKVNMGEFHSGCDCKVSIYNMFGSVRIKPSVSCTT